MQCGVWWSIVVALVKPGVVLLKDRALCLVLLYDYMKGTKLVEKTRLLAKLGGSSALIT